MPINFTIIPEMTSTDIVRFYSKIDIKTKDECWLWLDHKSYQGYGRFSWRKKELTATRVLWKLFYKEDPGSLYVCHTCNNPQCCNPNHLFLGNQSENTLQKFAENRMYQKGSLGSKAMFCDDEVRLIRKLEDTMSISQIAKRYGVHYTTIHKIVRGVHYKDIL